MEKNKDKTKSIYYQKIIDIVATYMNYENTKQFNTLIPKKIKELREAYPDEVIFDFFVDRKKTFEWISNKEFKSDSSRVVYFFAVVQNNINDYYKVWKMKKRIELKENSIVSPDIMNTIGLKDRREESLRDITELIGEG